MVIALEANEDMSNQLNIADTLGRMCYTLYLFQYHHPQKSITEALCISLMVFEITAYVAFQRHGHALPRLPSTLR